MKDANQMSELDELLAQNKIVVEDKKNDPFKVLFVITLLSIVMYGVLFYLFMNHKLKVETLLSIILAKFILTASWTYWMRFREKRDRK